MEGPWKVVERVSIFKRRFHRRKSDEPSEFVRALKSWEQSYEGASRFCCVERSPSKQTIVRTTSYFGIPAQASEREGGVRGGISSGEEAQFNHSDWK
jgi:hypothetical protein